MNTPSILVTKRDGRQEPIDLDKIHRVITWAAEGLNNVSVSQVELKSRIQFYNGIRTQDIHETIIKAAADLISRGCPLDLHVRSFPAVSLAQSQISKANVVLYCLEAETAFEITVRRSFAEYLFKWLCEAGS